jgi:UDP-glucose 4-epimerase
VSGEPARSVLVTGASGLVGRQVVAQLAQEPGCVEQIVALDLREPPPELRRGGVTYLAGDIRDPELRKTLEAHGTDALVHLAAVVTPGGGSTRELEYAIDVLGTENVVEACLGAGVRQLVYTSSGAAYGYHPDNPVPLREDHPLRGNREFAYAHHKRLVEEMLERQRREHPELAQLIFRPGTILGESVQSPITAMFDRPAVVGVAGHDAPFVLIWDEDVAACIVKGLREGRSGIYNLAGDGAISLREIARRIGKPYLPLPAPLLRGVLGLLQSVGVSARGAEQVDFLCHRPVLDNQKLRSEFGFVPRFTSEECFEHFRRLRFGG